MAVNFTKNQDEITKAWREVVDSKESQKWALFGYEGSTNTIKHMSSGSNGLKELVSEFNCTLIQYAFCRVLDREVGINKLILINWQGDSSPLSRKGLCASHVGDVANYFKGCTQTITIRNDDEASPEYLMEQVLKTSQSRVSLSRQSNSAVLNINGNGNGNGNDSNSITDNNGSQEKQVGGGSTYRKTEISSDIASDRKSFWQRQEEEEKERLIEEKRRAAEKQAQFEKERKLREESEAKKLSETIKERDRIIEATRRAEKQQESSSSQPNSIIANSTTSNNNNNNDDDDRVGRRSEIIRLERNQETQSLITKGLINKKRAIFEQAANQQQQTATLSSSNLRRRASGTMIAQRINSAKLLDSAAGSTTTTPATTTSSSSSSSSSNTNSSTNVEKLSNGFAQNLKVAGGDGDDSLTSSKGIVKKQVETFKITNDEEQAKCSIVSPKENEIEEEKVNIVLEEKSSQPSKFVNEKGAQEEVVVVVVAENGNNNIENNKSIDNDDKEPADSNGNNIHKEIKQQSIKQQEEKEVMVLDNHVSNGLSGIKAKALYDYQATDNTEISFDPDDIIGCIEKVDPGWWHGQVVSGKFKGKAGLFPSNYVEEL